MNNSFWVGLLRCRRNFSKTKSCLKEVVAKDATRNWRRNGARARRDRGRSEWRGRNRVCGDSQLPNAHIIQADIYQSAVGARCLTMRFPSACCITCPIRAEVSNRWPQRSKPGGHISAWVYGAENNEWITRWVNPLREAPNFAHEPAICCYSFPKLPAALMFAATKLVYGPLNRSQRGASSGPASLLQ